ncbi:hypothetical protein JCM17823_24090 [Halorubrum gandharaense]
MHTRRRALTTTGTVLATLSLSATTGAADTGSSPATTEASTTGPATTESPTTEDLLDPATDDGTFAFIDLHALRGSGDSHSGADPENDAAREEILVAVESAVSEQVDEFGIDAEEVLAYAAGDRYLSLTGTFDAVTIRLQLLFGSYDGVGEHAGLDCYVDEAADRAVAFTDGELLVTVDELGTESGIRHTVDIATGGEGGTENPPTESERGGDEAVAALHEPLAGEGFVVGRPLGNGEGPAGADAAALERRFADGELHDRHAYAFDRPGRVPLPPVENHVARGEGELSGSTVVGDCAVVETVVDGDGNSGEPPAIRA